MESRFIGIREWNRITLGGWIEQLIPPPKYLINVQLIILPPKD